MELKDSLVIGVITGVASGLITLYIFNKYIAENIAVQETRQIARQTAEEVIRY